VFSAWLSSVLPRNAYASVHLLANQINCTAYHKHLLNSIVYLVNTVDCIHGQKTNSGIIDNLIAFSTLLVCILPHCLLRDWCGILRNDSVHVVCCLDQSASFCIFDSTFYFTHSTIPHLTHCLSSPV